MTRIPPNDVRYHPLSFADPMGRLFSWKGHLYRAIKPGQADHCRLLFKNGVVSALVEKGLLIETEMTDLTLDGYDLVLSHRRLPFVSYAYEWCGEMLKDAALAVIDLETELLMRDLTLQDAHPWNLLFDGCRAIYVDFGSIAPANPLTQWRTYDEFCRFFLYPIQLMSQGHGRIARWLLHDHEKGVLPADLAALTNQSLIWTKVRNTALHLAVLGKQYVPKMVRPRIRKAFRTIAQTVLPKEIVLGLLRQSRRELEALHLPSLKTPWPEYYAECSSSMQPADDWTPKHRSTYEVLCTHKPKSLLDMGSNTGWFSRLAGSLKIPVVACDVAEECITPLYREAKEKRLPILPLIMDFRNPSPGYGLCNEWLAPATERLKCEMVLALAFVHHLVFRHQLNFEQITKGLSLFTESLLLVEFIPKEDQYVRQWWNEEFSWYTLPGFQQALEKHFTEIYILPSFPKPRCLLLCKK